MRVALLFGMLLLLAFSPGAHAQKKLKAAVKPAVVTARALTRADSLVLQARVLVSKQQEAEALDKCRQAVHENPVQYEALWRASVLSCRIGGRFTDETRKYAYFDNARGYAARALEIHPAFATANYAMALAIASMGALLPLRGRLSARLEQKPYLDAALKDEPDNADAWQLLGRWQFKVANYSLLEKVASRLLLGDVPQGATNAAAVASLRQAIAHNPRRIDFYYDLARMHQLRRQRRQAIQVLLEAQQVELVTTEDLAVSRQCQALLEQLERRERPDTPELRPR